MSADVYSCDDCNRSTAGSCWRHPRSFSMPLPSRPEQEGPMDSPQRPTHFVSCTRLPGQCCGSCHYEENEGYNNLYIENADVGPSTVVGVRSCCVKNEAVEQRVVKMTARLGGTGRRW